MNKFGTTLNLVVIVTATLLINSCTVQKRYHNKGFNIEWNILNSKHNNSSTASNPSTKRNSNSVNSSEISTTNNVAISENPQTNQQLKTSENLQLPLRSTSNFKGVTDFNDQNPNPKIVQHSQVSKLRLSNNPSSNKSKHHYSVKRLKESNSTAQDSNSGNSGTKVFGTILIILGILILLFVNIYGGVILLALGLIIKLIASASGNSSQPLPAGAQVVETAPASQEVKKTEYVDVIYLKNGSIIRGMVMEQIPNESIKIQTADGSLFVYKMDEVLKITKELKQ